MKRSESLPLEDVKKVFRALGHARDLRHDQTQQEILLVDSMTELLGAQFGHAVRFAEFRPETPTYIHQYIPGSIHDPSIERYLSEWGRNSSFEDSPLKHVTWDKQGPVYTTSRSTVMSYEDVMPYRIYDELVEPSRINDVLLTFFRYPGSNHTRHYIFQRTTAQREFDQRDLNLAHLFTTELYQIYRENALEPRDQLTQLPQRLQTLAYQLRTSRNQKQIAESMNLSYHTVRSYSKELYDIVGVSSREELVARLFGSNMQN